LRTFEALAVAAPKERTNPVDVPGIPGTDREGPENIGGDCDEGPMQYLSLMDVVQHQSELLHGGQTLLSRKKHRCRALENSQWESVVKSTKRSCNLAAATEACCTVPEVFFPPTFLPLSVFFLVLSLQIRAASKVCPTLKRQPNLNQ